VGLHRHGRPTDPDALDREVTAAEVEEVGEVLRELVPTLPGTFVRAVACLYTTTPDQDFVIGLHPAHPNVAVACGFSGHGFKFVPVVGEVLADLALEGRSSRPIGLFDPTRFG
jgi:sarcosine oxidase